jgi:hypothetical protein
VASAAFSPSAWKFRKPLPADPAKPLIAVRLDTSVYVAARPDLGDVRIVHNGQEMPFVLEQLTGKEESREVQAEVLDKSAGAAGLQVTLSAGAGAKHNRVRIETTQKNFRESAIVETSADNRNWAVVRKDASLFDFTEPGRAISLLSIDYPDSSRAFVRLTIPGWHDPKFLTEAFLSMREVTPAVRDTLETLAAKPVEDAATQSTLLTLDLGAPVPCGYLRFNIKTPRFSRAVEIESGADGKTWQTVSTGVLSRVAPSDTVALEFPEQHLRYLRVRIFNRDDRPLEIESIPVEVIERRLKFETAEGGEWWLYYGNPDARPPVYDLAALLARTDAAAGDVLKPGAEFSNPDFRPPKPPERPWTDQHPGLLYGTLAIAIVGLGAATVKFFMQMKVGG